MKKTDIVNEDDCYSSGLSSDDDGNMLLQRELQKLKEKNAKAKVTKESSTQEIKPISDSKNKPLTKEEFRQ